MSSGMQFLHNVSLFANLSTSELEPLAQRLATRRFRTDEHIFEQGSPSNSLYIVKSGLVKIVITDKAGHCHTVAQFGPGQVFGEFALLDGLPRSAGAVAAERSELLILTRPEFFMYLEQHPTVAVNLLVLLSRRLRFATQQTEHDEAPQTTCTRLARLLYDLVMRYGVSDDGQIQLSIRLTQGEIAGMMGCPRSDAQAAIELLQQQAIIEIRGLQITVRNLDELRAAAEQSN